MMEIVRTARTAPEATAWAKPTGSGLASAKMVAPASVASATATPIADRSPTANARASGRHDRLRGPVGLDHVAEYDTDEKRQADLALGDGQPERDRFGDPVDEEAGRDRFPARRAGLLSRYLHRSTRHRGVAGPTNCLGALVPREPGVRSDVDGSAGEKPGCREPLAGALVGVGDELERHGREENAAAERGQRRGDPFRQRGPRGEERADHEACPYDDAPAEPFENHGRSTHESLLAQQHGTGRGPVGAHQPEGQTHELVRAGLDLPQVEALRARRCPSRAARGERPRRRSRGSRARRAGRRGRSASGRRPLSGERSRA